MQRKSGVLMHISSLWGDYSIGSFGSEAKEFIDFLAECKFTYWQVLPFCMVDECNSPYKSYSTFGGNPYFVDLKKLREKGLVTDEELAEYRQENPYVCEYVRLYHTRLNILKKASERVKNREEIEEFIENRVYLKQFCEFMSLKSANNQLPWQQWTNTDADEGVLFMWKFIQYEFFSMWKEIKTYANKKGIKIIGDIPIYVDLDSCDVWANRDNFMLDEDNRPTLVAGVPPDYFCADGQLWGNPIYNWDAMKTDGFTWWRDRICHMTELFDGIRIDHFRGIESYWAVDGNAKTAREGKWMKGPGMELINVIKEAAGGAMIIAEDLGDITDDVRKLVDESGFPGMRVFQFAFLGDASSPHMPHNYVKNSVAYTGTHDNNTLLGYLWELDDGTRRRMLEYCGHTKEEWQDGCLSVMRAIFASHADTVIMPIQDLLGYGSDTRLNIPGKSDGNWTFRITRDQLNSIDKNKFKKLNEIYARA